MSQVGEHIESLLQLCLKGNQRAQMEIYNRYYKAMYNTAHRIVKDRAEAEDIMQESFLNAFTKLHSFKGNVAFGAWLKKIVINKSLVSYRNRKKKNEVSLNDTLYKVRDNDVAEAIDVDTEQLAQQVLTAMKSLKENYRVSLTLHLIEGYDYEEICGLMDISYANCRTMISRAKESLRKKLDPVKS
ncbi:MAG: RNA polymerase sigma factor [Flavobacteriaceae bacterium]|nr:RNA polymerase sigma factor [Muriicola sp.]NNC63062.1 RNA polymerase sigma factor [Eudoraea sp.]NNK20522.1 RNA polymerase sigma factor [Flavobacteriaceae bacterium]MBT8291191.1 RNA polymerase sigma factor [Muriicola sp.]NNK36390.1 RNA polymerase sigma factor [Eudoraea sp.]